MNQQPLSRLTLHPLQTFTYLDLPRFQRDVRGTLHERSQAHPRAARALCAAATEQRRRLIELESFIEI